MGKIKGVIDPIKIRTVYPDKWEVLEAFEWNKIIVESGFVTDFASIPSLLRGLLNPVGRIRPAALVHDWLYFKLGKSNGMTFSRKECDKEFLKIMEFVDMPYFKRKAAYRAVRLFGWKGWNRRKKQIEGK